MVRVWRVERGYLVTQYGDLTGPKLNGGDEQPIDGRTEWEREDSPVWQFGGWEAREMGFRRPEK